MPPSFLRVFMRRIRFIFSPSFRAGLARIIATRPNSRRMLIKMSGKSCICAVCGYRAASRFKHGHGGRIISSASWSRRWPRDTCYHFASPGIFIAGANEPTGWWSIASRDNQWRHSNRYPLAIFKRTKYSYSFKSRRYYWPALPASCFAEARLSAIRIHSGRIDKKVWHTPEENGGKKKKKKINLWRFGNSLSENFEKFQKIWNMGKLKLLDTLHSAFPSFFLVYLTHCLNKTNHLHLFIISLTECFNNRATSDKALHPAFCMVRSLMR